MVRIKATRKARFTAALALIGKTQEEWAKEEGEVSRTQLNEFLNGKRVSAPLTAKVDAFIKRIESAEVVAA